MKKKLTAVLIVFALALSVISCGATDISADDMAFKILSLYDTVPPCSQYIKYAEEYSTGYISEEDFSYLYTGKSSGVAEWDMAEQFRIILSDAPMVFEIHIIKATSSSEAELVYKLVSKRIKLIDNYRKSENQIYPANEAVAYRKGCFVFLLATPDNNAAIGEIDRIL